MELCVFPNALPCVIVPVKRGHKGGCCHKQDTAEGKGKHCHSRFFLILGKVHYAKSKRSKAAAHFLVCGLFHIVLRHIASIGDTAAASLAGLCTEIIVMM